MSEVIKITVHGNSVVFHAKNSFTNFWKSISSSYLKVRKHENGALNMFKNKI